MSTFQFIVLLSLGCLIALGTLELLIVRVGDAQPLARFAPLDGLRGFAAFAVFFDHAACWNSVWRTGRWDYAADVVWTVGATAVALFFMTTAFLFVDKVVFSAKDTDWLALLVSRVLRIVPLFGFVFAVVLVIVAQKTSGFRESPAELIVHVARWLPLTAFGTPDINRLPRTWMTVANVTWTLPYECVFYLALPAIAVFSGRKVPRGIVLGTSFALLTMLATSIAPGATPQEIVARMASFPVGAGAAALIGSRRWGDFAKGRLASAIAVIALAASLVVPPVLGKLWLVVMPGIAFLLIASGNSLFGVLTSRSSRLLGQISYSIYLLHGLLLYGVVGELLGSLRTPGAGSDRLYWAVALGLVPVLMVASYLSHRLIELPWMARTMAWTGALRGRRAAQHRRTV